METPYLIFNKPIYHILIKDNIGLLTNIAL
jgi:hypothetical protein